MSGLARRPSLLLPTAATALMLAVLIALGTWQFQRLRWKQGLLDQIARAEAAPPIPLPADPTPFAKVEVSGTLRTDLSVLYGADVHETPTGPAMGAQLVTPLTRPGAPALLVKRGWVPTDRPRPADQPPGPATFEGFVRIPDRPGAFAATDDPGKRLFYTLDPKAVGAALGLADVAPYVLTVLGPPPPARYPEPATTLPRPPNDHLFYAVTWYGLAVVLVVVFASFVAKRRRPT